MSQTAFLAVSPLVARNPVAISIEKASMRKWLADVVQEMSQMRDGEPAQSLIVALVETLAVATKTLEGWEEDGGLREVMTDAIVAMEQMAHSGYVWNTSATELVSEATDYAIQILIGMSPKDKQEAWVWAQQRKAAARASVSKGPHGSVQVLEAV